MNFLVKKAISPSNFSRPPPTIAPLPAPSTPASRPLYPRFRTLYSRFRTLYPRTPPPSTPSLLLTCWSEGHSKSACLYMHIYAMAVKRIYTTAALETLSSNNRHICCLSAPTTALYIKAFSHTLHLCFILYTEDAILFII